MNENEKTLVKFYSAFANGDFDTMRSCYHKEAQFRDPAFGLLKGTDIFDMWEMLIKRSKGDLKIEFYDVTATEYLGSARWKAEYKFSKTNRDVINTIKAQYQFKDGLIFKHIDDFDLWKWTEQAFGIKGFLFGWTGFFHQKINEQALLSLKQFKENKYGKL